ncbi:MAG: transcriptional regulator, LysR family [Verrucomicrobiales bacterium]|nr:transcriptional regulator, LysR family [Verrucomicrobiales bacterium]
MFDTLIQNGLTLNALRSFLLVAANGGYSKAAGGDPAISANLKNRVAGLHDPFHKVPLFQPRGRGVILTGKGHELQRIATQALQLLEDFISSCQEERQIVRVGGGQSLFDGLFLPRWQHIHTVLPSTRFQFHNLRTADAVKQLQEQRLDFALIRPDAPGLETMEYMPLGHIKFALFVPSRLMKRTSSPPRLSEVMRKLPLATISGDGQFKKQLQGFATSQRFDFQYVIECTSQSQVLSFLHTGAVGAVLPELLGGTHDGINRFPLDAGYGFMREAALAWLPSRIRTMPELETARIKILESFTLAGRPL